MTKNEMIEKCMKLQREAVERGKQCDAVLTKREEEGRFPQVGDVYLFPPMREYLPTGKTLPEDVILEFALIAVDHHEGGDLFFCVPLDWYPETSGLCDVPIRHNDPFGPMCLRCGHGLWLGDEEFQSAHRVAILAPRYTERARNKMAQMVRGKLEGTSSQRETECDPFYEEEVLDRAECASEWIRYLRDEGRLNGSATQPVSLADLREIEEEVRKEEQA